MWPPGFTLAKLVFLKNVFRVKWVYGWMVQIQNRVLLRFLQIQATALFKKTRQYHELPYGDDVRHLHEHRTLDMV